MPGALAVAGGKLHTNAGDGLLVPVSRQDCAAAAASVLTSEGHAGKTYDITGTEGLAPNDLVALYSDLSGQPVKVVQLNDPMLTSVLVGIGTPMSIAVAITAWGRAVRQGYFDLIDATFERLTGRPPRTLREVLVAHRADLLAVA
jgi:NAD(P)H dehydrogenase (quinone)